MSTDQRVQQAYIPYNPAFTAKARANRANPTPAETKLWREVLHDRQLAGHKFVRQKPIDAFVVDFYCAELRLAIEIDGDTHADQADYDAHRTARLDALGVRLVRYSNRDVLDNLDGVAADLADHMAQRRMALSQEGA